MPALSPHSLIAITGITGYIASHVGLAALKAGHRVRGTVRSLDRAETLKAAYRKQNIRDIDNSLEFVVVDDLLSVDQVQRALQGVDGVVHAAVQLDQFGDAAFINLAVRSMLSLLGAAQRVQSIRRVVIVSSSAAVIQPPIYRDKILTEDDWNDQAVRIVEQNEPTDTDEAMRGAAPFLVYAAAKTKAEKIAWDFIHNEKPQFDLVSTLPSTSIGPILHGNATSTGAWVGALLDKEKDATMAEIIPPQWFINIEDLGRLHVLSLTTESVGGRRIIAAATPYGWNTILAIMRKNFPHARVHKDFEGSHGETDPQRMDNELAKEMLGGFIGLEKSVVDLGKSLGY